MEENDSIDVPLYELKGEQKTDSELAPKEDRWREELPKLPTEDLKRCGKILERITDKYSQRNLEAWNTWTSIQGEASQEFEKIGIQAHVDIVIRCVNTETGQEEDLRKMVGVTPGEEVPEHVRAELKPGYLIHDGDFLVPPGYMPRAISPVIVLDDWEELGTKKDKAEQAIIEREHRRSMGGDYFPTIDEAMRTDVGRKKD